MTPLNRLTNSVAPSVSEAADLRQLLAPIRPALERVETLLAEQANWFEPSLRPEMSYLLQGTGKRLRPALALLAGGASGGITDKHLIMSVAMELIHLATLVHDDVLDDATLRHGQPTANERWGNHVSILLGDCLLARSLHLTALHTDLLVCQRISEATNSLCTGEILQSQYSFDSSLTVERYLDIIDRKTGALFAVSCEIGARLNHAPTDVIQALHHFGSRFGIVYQIYDDCVDVFGQERHAGKSLGTDMRNGKLTLPLLLLLQHTPADRREGVSEVIFRGTVAEREQLVRLALGNGVVSESLFTIESHVNQAKTELGRLAPNPHTRALAGLLDTVMQRSRALLREQLAA